MANFSFKATPDVERHVEHDGFAPIPEQWYPALIEKDEIRVQAEGKAQTMAATYTIAGKSYANRKIFHNFNLSHTENEAYVNMGKAQFAKLCDALGIGGFDRTEDLHNKLHAVKVAVKPARKDEVTGKEYAAQNIIVDWMPLAQLETLQANFVPKGGKKESPKAAELPQDDFSKAFAQSAPAESTQTSAALPEQPWESEKAKPAEPAPKVETAPVVAPAAEQTAWEADGWKTHPKSAAHVYKGKELKTLEEVKAMYAPAPALEVPELDIPGFDDAPSIDAASSDGLPPWATAQ